MIKRLLLFLCCIFLILNAFFLIPTIRTTTTQYIEQKLSKASGLNVHIERMDFFPPFFIRAHHLSCTDETNTPLIMCEKLSITPLFVDMFFGKCTFLQARARGVFCDTDKIEQYVKNQSSTQITLPDFWIPFFSVRSAYIKSQRLPEPSLDCSFKGGFYLPSSLSMASVRITITQNQPQKWPNKLSIKLQKKKDQIDLKAKIHLSTKNTEGPKNLIFDEDDSLSVALTATIDPTKRMFIQKMDGTWKLECPRTTRTFNTYAVQLSGIGEGKIKYFPQQEISISCEELQAYVSFGKLRKPSEHIDGQNLIINYPFKPIQTIRLKGRAKLNLFSKEGNRYLMRLNVPMFSINSLPLRFTSELNFTFQNGQLTSSADLSGTMYHNEFFLRGSSVIDAHKVALSADLSASAFHLFLNYQTENLKSESWISLRCRDLAIFQPFIRQSLGGRTELSFHHITDPKRSLSCKATISDFTFGKFHCGDSSFTFSNNDLTPNIFSFSSEIFSLSLPFIQIDRAHSSSRFDFHTKELEILDSSAIGQINNLPIDITSQGHATYSSLIQTLDIIHLDGHIGPYDLLLEQPLHIERTHDYISQLSGYLRIGQNSRISGNWTRNSRVQAIGDLNIEHLPLPLLFSTTPNIDGYLNGHIYYHAQASTIDANGQLNTEIFRTASLGLPNGHIALGSTFSIYKNKFKSEMCAAGTGIPNPTIINFSSPIERITNTPYITMSPEAPINLHAEGNVHLSELLGPWMPIAAYFDGIINFNIKTKGTYFQPEYTGTVNLNQGRIDLLHTGEALTDIAMQGKFMNNVLEVSSIQATDDKEGVVHGTGNVKFTRDNGLEWMTQLTCKNIEFISVDYARFTADGTVQLEGTAHTLKISGSTTTREAHIDLAARFPVSAPELPITFRHDQPKTSTPFTVNFDLTVDGSSGLNIEGRGLKSIWQGKAHLKGPATQLNMDGQLRCQKGSFTLANKELTISQGTISVAGNLFRDSRLNITADTTLPTITARIIVRGSLENPKISIQSTPPRTDNEILSLLLFNKEYSDLSPLESLQLANTALTLEHTSGPFQLIDKVKQTIGIDVIDIGSSPSRATSPGTASQLDTSDTSTPGLSQQNEVSLRVGKYISQGVIVSVSRDISSDANRVGISAPLFYRITAEAEVGDDAVGIVSIKWKKDY